MGARKIEIQTLKAADLGLGPNEVGESAARERVLSVGAPPARPAGRIITDEGDGGKQVAEYLVSIGIL